MSAVSGSAGSAAAQQLMQAINTVKNMTAQQISVVNGELQETKAWALQQTAQQVNATIERKGNTIDLMV